MIRIEGVGLKEEVEALFMAIIHLIIYFNNSSSLGVDEDGGIGLVKGEKQEMWSLWSNNFTHILNISLTC